MKRILIVCPYPEGKAPSQRFRIEQYLAYVRENRMYICISSFWNAKQWPAIYRDSSIAFRMISTLLAFVKRFFLLFSLPQYDTVFIHREATPIGPPWWEWCAAKVFRKRLIYDFDDAVWLPNSSEGNAKLVGKLKNHGKTGKIISWSETVFAGNSFLAEYAGRYCDDVRVVPTTIDLNHHKLQAASRKLQDDNRGNGNVVLERGIPTEQKVGMTSKTEKSEIFPVSVIGWTGTHSTLKQLVPLFPLLEKVYAQHPFKFLLIADIAPENMPDFVEFRKWRKETEIEDLLEMHIGIMPLYDTEWERGKCGFKALQYMALEIPAVVSGVGVNEEIVKDGETGFVCEPITDSSADLYSNWESKLLTLLTNGELRKVVGRNGRVRVKLEYSTEAFKNLYYNIFKI